MDDDAAAFWRKFEADRGERVKARGMGQWFEDPPRDRGLWGLLVLTDRSFRFLYMPGERPIIAFFKAPASSAPKEEKEIAVPLGDILSVEEPRRGLLERLFGPPFPPVVVAWSEGGIKRRATFTIDPGSGFAAALREAAAVGRPPPARD